jgi:hypothetical protein
LVGGRGLWVLDVVRWALRLCRRREPLVPIVVDVDLEPLPLLPTDMHRLVNGAEPAEGDRVRKHKIRNDDGTSEWDGTYEHQSSRGVVHSLVARMKAQRVWSRDEAFTQCMSPDHLGTRWLREQDDPRVVFEELWDSAYDLDPRLSLQQLVTLLLTTIRETPGIQLVYLRELAARHGWRNRGHLASLLDGLVADGTLSEQRTYGPSGKQVTSRRFWTETTEAVAVVAKTTTVTVSLGLLAVGSTRSAKGQRTPGRERSFLRLLTDKELRREGLRLLRSRLARLRPWSSRRRAPRPSSPPPPLTPDEVAYCLDGLHLGGPSAPVRAPVPMGSIWSLACLT